MLTNIGQDFLVSFKSDMVGRHKDNSRSSLYSDNGHFAAVITISRIHKNILKHFILAFLALFPCYKELPTKPPQSNAIPLQALQISSTEPA